MQESCRISWAGTHEIYQEQEIKESDDREVSTPHDTSTVGGELEIVRSVRVQAKHDISIGLAE
jgi:hypothetical protein